jgi:GT2 family glycosyltransferase
MPAPSLTAAIVTYRPEPRLFARALASLAAAIVEAHRLGALGDARVMVVDNGPEESRTRIAPAVAAWPAQAGSIEVVSGHGNVGYGRANNLALARAGSDFHLIMNPDVELEPDALAEALAALAQHPRWASWRPRCTARTAACSTSASAIRRSGCSSCAASRPRGCGGASRPRSITTRCAT